MSEANAGRRRCDRTASDFAIARLQQYMISGNLLDCSVEIGSNFSVLDAVINVRQDPVLNVGVHLRPAVSDSHASAMPP